MYNGVLLLNFKVPSKIVANDNLNVVNYFPGKIRPDISCELSARQTIHMTCQALFSLKYN